MKIMYREEYSRKKLPAIIEIFFLMTFMIFVSDGIKGNIINNMILSLIVSAALPLAIILSVFFAIIRCRYKFRYSLIADQFIVHSISGQEQSIEQNIKNEEIIGIKEINTMEFLLKRVSHKCYILSLFNRRIFSCTYKQGEKVETFFFQPSENFIYKIRENMTCDRERMVS